MCGGDGVPHKGEWMMMEEINGGNVTVSNLDDRIVRLPNNSITRL